MWAILKIKLNVRQKIKLNARQKIKLNARQKAYDPAAPITSSTATTTVEWYNWRRMVHMITTNKHISCVGVQWL